MGNCSNGDVPISKGDKLSTKQCPITEFEIQHIKDKPYASLVSSVMYAQVCTRPELAFALSVLGRFQSNQGFLIGMLERKISTSGYVFMLAGGAISWRSKKQQMKAVSTMESEYIGCFEAMR
ncbi:secreted RxLR effector protein 161-like [Pyrus communis]|uniref:secreted RxLR effector protein 161-like n=1 Tax=Pyrus communis TaxID=23211 RepID=UPI0035BF1879